MTTWQEFKFTDYVELNPNIDIDKNNEYPFIEMQDLIPGNKYVYPSSKRKPDGLTRFEEGDTLFAKITPCLENGKICKARGLKGGIGIGSTEFFVFRGKKGISDNDFVHYILKWYPIKQFAIKNMTGSSGHQRVPSDIFENIFLKLPNLEESIIIGQTLSLFDDKIELLRRQNETLEQMAQALFKHWFVDFEFPNKEGKPYKSSGGRMKSSELGDIPEDWRVEKIKNLGNVVCGKTPSKSVREYFDGDIPFIKIPDMHGKIFIINTEDKLSAKGSSFQSNKLIPDYSINVSCIATVGLVTINSKPSHTNQQINSIIPHYGFSLEYLYFSMKKLSSYLNSLGSGGSATLNVNTSTFSNIEILFPKHSIIEKFHSIVKVLFEKIELNYFMIMNLQNIRDALLPKLMSGQIRVGK